MNIQSQNRILEARDRGRWREELAAPISEKRRLSAKTFVFRCGDEWFSIDPNIVVSVMPMLPVHSIPNRSHSLAGVVNFRGVITLCFLLDKVLQSVAVSEVGRPMLLALKYNNWLVACRVEEVSGMIEYDSFELKAPPATLVGVAAGRITGLFSFEGRSIACLNVEKLFDRLKDEAR